MVLDSNGLVMLVPGRHDDKQVHVAVLMRRAVGVGAEQDDLIGMKLLGDGPGIAADHPHRDVRPPIDALWREGKRACLCSSHTAIVPQGQARLPASRKPGWDGLHPYNK